MRHNDVRISATRNKDSRRVRVRYMVVVVCIVYACKVRCCVECHSVVVSSGGGTKLSSACCPAQQISLDQLCETMSRYTACSRTVSGLLLPWMLDYCTHERGMGCPYRRHPYGTAVQQMPASLVVHDPWMRRRCVAEAWHPSTSSTRPRPCRPFHPSFVLVAAALRRCASPHFLV
jgi:hypothetical protein